MTSTPGQLYRGVLTTSSQTLFTNVSGTRTVISTALVANGSASPVTFTLGFDGVNAFSNVTVPANSTLMLDNLRQVLINTQSITAQASAASSIALHISGTVIS